MATMHPAMPAVMRKSAMFHPARCATGGDVMGVIGAFGATTGTEDDEAMCTDIDKFSTQNVSPQGQRTSSAASFIAAQTPRAIPDATNSVHVSQERTVCQRRSLHPLPCEADATVTVTSGARDRVAVVCLLSPRLLLLGMPLVGLSFDTTL